MLKNPSLFLNYCLLFVTFFLIIKIIFCQKIYQYLDKVFTVIHFFLNKSTASSVGIYL